MEVVSCMCRAAGIKLAKEEHIRLENVLNADADDYARFMDDYFYDKGLLFLSDELSATIKAEQTVGEEYTTGMSRLVGVIVNCKGIFYVYCTLDRLMRWIISYERRRVAAISRLFESSDAAKANDDFAEVCASVPKSVIIGKTCAMIPKIITGNKYGKVVENASRSTITDKLMTLANLEQVYACNYFVPTNTLGVELLSRTVTLTRSDLNSMIEMWLSEMTERYTTVSSREYVEAYIEDQEDKTLMLFCAGPGEALTQDNLVSIERKKVQAQTQTRVEAQSEAESQVEAKVETKAETRKEAPNVKVIRVVKGGKAPKPSKAPDSADENGSEVEGDEV